MELDGMYRGKCPDGDRCLHGCHTSERCFYAYAKDAEGRKLDDLNKFTLLLETEILKESKS